MLSDITSSSLISTDMSGGRKSSLNLEPLQKIAYQVRQILTNNCPKTHCFASHLVMSTCFFLANPGFPFDPFPRSRHQEIRRHELQAQTRKIIPDEPRNRLHDPLNILSGNIVWRGYDDVIALRPINRA